MNKDIINCDKHERLHGKRRVLKSRFIISPDRTPFNTAKGNYALRENMLMACGGGGGGGGRI